MLSRRRLPETLLPNLHGLLLAVAYANRPSMGSQPAEAKARTALRAATHDVHQRIHVAPPFLRLADGKLTRDEYAELLSALAAYYFAASRHVPLEPGRLQRLRHDLDAVGAPPPPGMDESLVPRAGSELGWRYVVEGSIFGGRVIYRQLDCLFEEEEAGRSFFLGTGASVRHWQTLCAQIEEAARVPGALERMVGGALDAFAAFESAIGEWKPCYA